MLSILSKIFGKEKPSNGVQRHRPSHKVEDVGRFYDEYNDKFLQVYGDVIQAFRTHDLAVLLDYQIDAMELKPGMKAIDAGCGICGPATYFAKQVGIKVDAITISAEQVSKAREKIAKEGMGDNVRVTQGDYHQLSTYFPKESYDVVYFLESFGHSPDHKKVFDSAWEVLKPGGMLYIKDLFRRVPLLEEQDAKIEREIEKINEAYRYNIADLYEVLHYLRKKGFVISAMKTIDLPLEQFENLTISNEFQELTGMALIEDWNDYVFPVDFFELKLYKPQFKLENGLDKYFLQNLYYMQVYNRKQEEL